MTQNNKSAMVEKSQNLQLLIQYIVQINWQPHIILWLRISHQIYYESINKILDKKYLLDYLS